MLVVAQSDNGSQIQSSSPGSDPLSQPCRYASATSNRSFDRVSRSSGFNDLLRCDTIFLRLLLVEVLLLKLASTAKPPVSSLVTVNRSSGKVSRIGNASSVVKLYRQALVRVVRYSCQQPARYIVNTSIATTHEILLLALTFLQLVFHHPVDRPGPPLQLQLSRVEEGLSGTRQFDQRCASAPGEMATEH
jgi:hypothetical protein